MVRRLFDDDDEHATTEVIRELFKELGSSVPIRILANELVDRHLLSDALVRRVTIRGVSELCRTALSKKTAENLPLAQPTGSGPDDPWMNLDLFDYAQAEKLIERRVKGLSDDYAELRKLHSWCFDKFGRAPQIPELQQPDDDDPRAGDTYQAN
jgi:hypothetical protein